jgi:hypothetical protein
MKNDLDLMDVIKFWQNDHKIHALTCGKCGKILVAEIDCDGVYLGCPDDNCDYIQRWIPDCVIDHYNEFRKHPELYSK